MAWSCVRRPRRRAASYLSSSITSFSGRSNDACLPKNFVKRPSAATSESGFTFSRMWCGPAVLTSRSAHLFEGTQG